MQEKEEWSCEQVSRFPYVEIHNQSEVENIDLDDPKGFIKHYDQNLELHSNISRKGEKFFDPTLDGLMKGM